ncbi:hypothetical protein PY093_01260 [Cytobacillus sp. S13-E01]|uniref:hypothetical protein n=1 Tax=Cytobacillus sp. S13-E01 TaxID=3031326 RepID=UPI0023D81CA1|nr:hypothetical protein [Cytobacillus sp. S13-E01]MDF0725335.1 hypothetical protein [Cytobacillus sp. S13-E01]
MNSLQDAIYNWLTIKVVVDARPDDTAAQETYELFNNMLLNDHKLSNIIVKKDDVMYEVFYEKDGESKKARFPIELIDIMHDQIEKEPEKYNNYPI